MSIAEVAGALGGPVGSIYHRFASRDVLLARLWLRTVGDFQAGLFDLADAKTDDPLVEMALHVPRFCRDRPEAARALTLFRQSDLVAAGGETRDAAREVNRELDRCTARLTAQRFGRDDPGAIEVVVIATRLSPYGLVRPWLGGPVPLVIDDAVRASTGAILGLIDGPG